MKIDIGNTKNLKEELKMKGSPMYKTVIPFNGEQLNLMSWSHGFTHYVDLYGIIGFCGVDYFEENATKISKDLINGHPVY